MPPLVLPSFDDAATTEAPDPAAMEEANLAAYETGYRAGWEDAVAAEADGQERIRADLARNLQTLGFTYHEARNAMLAELRPLLAEIVGRVLPDLARRTLGEAVLAELEPLAAEAVGIPVELRCCPADEGRLAPLLTGQHGLELRLVADPTLAEGQVHLRLGARARHLDTAAAIAAIGAAVEGFFATELPEEARAHG